MIDFEFISPTKIYFGKDKELLIGQILKERNAKRVLLVLGKGSAFKSGLYDKVTKILWENGIEFFTLKNVRPNPDLSSVKEGLLIAKENNADFILAIGGGSVIDCAKSIAVSFFYNGDPYDFNKYTVKPEKALPIGVILTLAASGSELSSSCVISNDDEGLKQGFNSDLVRPNFAILNPELTYSVSKYQTGCGIVDIISHSLERYFCLSGKYEIADEFALTIIKKMIEVGEKCITKPDEYSARGAMMLLGAYSHNGLTSIGKFYTMSIHQLEHALSAYDNNIAHGAGLSVLIPAWMEYCYNKGIDKFAYFSKVVFQFNSDEKIISAKMSIISLKNYFKKIGMPTSLTELGIKKEDIPLIADRLTVNDTRVVGLKSIQPLKKEDVIKIFNLAL